MTKVMCSSQSNSISSMLARTLAAVDGCSSVWWDSSKVSGDRAIIEIDPDIIIYDKSQDIESLRRNAYNPNTGIRRVLVYCDDYKNEGPTPTIVVGTDHSRSLRSVSPQRDLADLSLYRQGSVIGEFSCKVCLITDYLNEISPEDNGDITNIIHETAQDLQTKAFGSVRLDMVNYLGQVDQNERVDIIRSSYSCLDFCGTQWRNILIAGGIPLVYKKKKQGGVSFDSFSELKDILANDYLEYYRQKIFTSARSAVEKNNFKFAGTVINKISDNSPALQRIYLQLQELEKKYRSLRFPEGAMK